MSAKKWTKIEKPEGFKNTRIAVTLYIKAYFQAVVRSLLMVAVRTMTKMDIKNRFKPKLLL
ncbi:hypothetical protein A9200_08140 [Maribacter hydrothermalis]|uniref:Uncharacterized protein n=1 Tax=Maribacter hydrothermalis TaxID=1836467 RepID=A0A1B7Z134_9FLAO|nr:hypothetical protein BTR34_12250 [Maribacter hydrothermalis]OBR36394.1 hypothetical protein A9200_08140 [Maribacter hydrothermalis]